MEGEVSGTARRTSDARFPSTFRTNSARRVALLAPAGLVLSFTLLGLALRLLRLDFQPLWWDEGYSAWFATHPLGDIIRLTAEDIHPPLYYVILHAWTLVAGPAPASLRLVSVAAGVAAIPLMYVAASNILSSRRAGLVAAFLVAINPLAIYYGQEVRMYGLVALLSLGVLWAAWEVMARPAQTTPAAHANPGFTGGTVVGGRLGPHIAYILFTTLALYTQYYAIFLPIALSLYAVWHWRRAPKRLLGWFGLQAAVALVYLPWVIYAGPRLTLYVSQKIVMDADRPLGLLTYFGRHLSAFAAGHLEGALAPWWPLALLLLAPVIAGIVWGTAFGRGKANAGEAAGVPTLVPDRPHPVPFLTTVLLTALLLGWLIGLRFPFFPDRGERLLLLALPAFIMLAAAGLDALLPGNTSEFTKTGEGSEPPEAMETSDVSHRSRWTAYAGLTLFVVVSAVSLAAFYTVPRYAGDDYRPLIARTIEQGLPGDTVFAVYPWQVGYWRSYAAGAHGPEAILAPSGEWGPEVRAALDTALSRGRVWFPAHLALGAMLETRVESYLSSLAIPFANTWYGPGTRLSGWWAADPTGKAPTAPEGAPVVRYELPGGTKLELVAATGPEGPVAASNGVAPITLTWRANAPLPELAVSVRLVDDLGQIWAQNDYEPLGAMVGAAGATASGGGWQAVDQFGLLVPAGTPPGTYRAELVVLPKDTGRPLTGFVPGAGATSAVRPFTVEVVPADRTVTPDRLPITERQAVDLGDGLRFLGYSVDRAPLTPGTTRRINLFWQATDRPASDYTSFVQLLGKDGTPVALWEAPPGAAHPTSEWKSGTLMRTQAFLRPGAEIPDGRYRLIAGMYRSADRARLTTAAGKDAVELGALVVKGRAHELEAERVIPGSATPLDIPFGSVARLAGYEGLPSRLTAGDESPVKLYWQALGSTPAPYTVFVHLVDEQTNAVIGYGDGEPGRGGYPTTGWLKGEYLADPHTIDAPAGATAGRPVRIEIGLYDPSTGQRLALPDGSTSFVLWRGQLDG